MKFKIKVFIFVYFILLSNTFICFAQSGNDGLYFNGISDGIKDVTSNFINLQTTTDRTYELSFKVIDATKSTKQFLLSEGGGDRGVVMYIEAGYLYLGAYNVPPADTYNWKGSFF